MNEYIKVRGARQHNLKNVNLDIPKNKLVVFTGVSGSGKSSLAYDTIYAEGQRRYVESLSSYARQFLGIMEKPDVDTIEGLSPAISIDQKTTSKNPRSTVGTQTEIYDYIRLLFAKIGHPHCPVCGREIASQSLDEILSSAISIIKEIVERDKIGRFIIFSPIVKDKKGEFLSLFDNLKAKGYKEVRVDNIIKELDEDFVLIKTNKHTIEAVIDKLSFSLKDLKSPIFLDNLKKRLSDSIEQALKLSDGLIIVSQIKDKGLELPKYPKEFQDHLFSEKFACPVDNIQIPEIEPRTFSFNSPHGACQTCSGIGKILKINPDFIISDELTLKEGAILPFANIFENDTWYSRLVNTVCEKKSIDTNTAIKYLSKEDLNILLYGTGEETYEVYGTNRFGRPTSIFENFSGFVNELERRHHETDSDWVRSEIEKYMREKVCPECGGTRLKKEALGITILSKSIAGVSSFSIEEAYRFFNDLTTKGSGLNEREENISKLIINEIIKRLGFLISVGLEYVTLDRPASSLSGGEAQRIRLASQIGSGLSGVLYILDEPTIGLHQKDNQKLINTLKNLRDLGNTVIVVEHDENMMRSADIIFDFGPGAGKGGGYLIAEGNYNKLASDRKSVTGEYLSGRKKINVVINKDKLINNNFFNNDSGNNNSHLVIRGCSQFNLKNIKVDFPLGKFIVITGVSGSGKSTLLVETLYPAIMSNINPLFRGNVGKYTNIEGLENLDKVILIDQSPIGRTPRSNPATYTKLFDEIREVFASTHDAKVAGYKKGRFSFNVKGGRCEACEGQGQIKIEMQFMSDIWVKCEVCKGLRYNAQTLDVLYKGKSIADVLSLTVTEAIEFFHINSRILNKLNTLSEVGLGYIELGQSATTLSGGEAQRVKLAAELSKKATGRTLYLLDEPTTGLHFADIEKLITVLKTLVAMGNSVFIIEHNMDVIKNADYIIDLGPDGGERGGEIVAEGTPLEIMKSKDSYTGQYLKSSKNK